MLTLTGGTVFLAWLSRQITARGIGNGIVLMLVAGIVIDLPREISELIVSNRLGMLTSSMLLALVLVIVAVAALVVMMERAQRCLPGLPSGRLAPACFRAGQSISSSSSIPPASCRPFSRRGSPRSSS
jgi:preprotein translocase subunit SecY